MTTTKLLSQGDWGEGINPSNSFPIALLLVPTI